MAIKLNFMLVCLLILNGIALPQEPIWIKTDSPNGGFSHGFRSCDSIVYLIISPEIFSTSPNSVEWQKLFTTQKKIIDFLPINNDTFLLITQDDGLIISSDRGATWITFGEGLLPNSINIVHRTMENIFLAGCGDGLYRLNSSLGLWVKIAFNGRNISLINSDSLGRIFVKSNGLNFSTNSGNTWQSIVVSFNGVFFDDIENVYYYDDIGLYKSNNLQQWVKIFDATTSNDKIRTCDYIGGNIVLISLGKRFLIRLTTNGVVLDTSFIVKNHLNNSKFGTSDIHYHKANNSIYARTPNGPYLSEDLGSSWQVKNEGIKRLQINKTSYLNDRLFLLTWYNGIYYSFNEGVTWVESNFPLHENPVQFTSTPNGEKLFCLTDTSIYYSLDSGFTWYFFYSRNSSGDRFNYLLATSQDTLLLGYYNSDRFSVSTNGGVTWNNKNLGAQAIVSNIFKFNSKIYRCFYSVTGDFLLQYSTDFFTNSFSITPQNSNYSNNCFVTSSGHFIVFGSQSIFVSTNSGVTWSISHHPNSSLKKEMLQNIKGDLFLASTLGISHSKDTGKTWNDYSSGLNEIYSFGLSMNSKGHLYITNNYGGLFRTLHSTTSVKDKNKIQPDGFTLYQNYPNPFNPTTVISYQLSASGNVTLKIYDILGNEVAKLINTEFKEAGYHNYQLLINNYQLPSGIYFYQLRAGSFTQTKKMILLR